MQNPKPNHKATWLAAILTVCIALTIIHFVPCKKCNNLADLEAARATVQGVQK